MSLWRKSPRTAWSCSMLPVKLHITIKGCGHCKKFKPIIDQVAKAFENEPKCKIIAINGDRERELLERYEIKGYPTVKFFPAPDKAHPIDYSGMRELEDVVDFLNDHCGTFRKPDGRLTPEAGARVDVEGRLRDALPKPGKVSDTLIAEFGKDDPYYPSFILLDLFPTMEGFLTMPGRVEMGLSTWGRNWFG